MNPFHHRLPPPSTMCVALSPHTPLRGGTTSLAGARGGNHLTAVEPEKAHPPAGDTEDVRREDVRWRLRHRSREHDAMLPQRPDV